MKKKKDLNKDTIMLFSKKTKISKLVDMFIVIPSFEIVKYLISKDIYLPNYIHKSLIRKNIAPTIASQETRDKFSDEMRHRLKWFDNFTIFQLEKLAETYNFKINVKDYKKDFWNILIRHREIFGISNLEFVKLQNLHMKYGKTPQESYEELYENFKSIYFEPKGYFNGVKINEARDVLLNSFTLTEVKELGEKLGVNVPRRLNKQELIDTVSIILELKPEQIEELSSKSILDIERYAKQNEANISVELKKSGIIEYIFVKMPKNEKEYFDENLKILEDINLEELLYDIKFSEILERVKSEKKKKMKKIRNIILVILLIGIVAASLIIFNVIPIN